MSRISHPFEPLYDHESRILILGSFPSVVSREQNFYYANKTNRFWKVMEKLFLEEISDRREFCHRRHIALWDVIASCSIRGSSDASITDVIPNDIASLIHQTDIHTVFTTGNTASRLYRKYIHLETEHIALPSTSAANASMRLDDLVRAYQEVYEKSRTEN
ncbi:MAG: DNA-deoxyinosine glycosylase [Solobacterium sp.]|nr:DNA-deoxyinosine glycosylase [Solobacterium sp.]